VDIERSFRVFGKSIPYPFLDRPHNLKKLLGSDEKILYFIQISSWGFPVLFIFKTCGNRSHLIPDLTLESHNWRRELKTGESENYYKPNHYYPKVFQISQKTSPIPHIRTTKSRSRGK
jgi:hypothetical protein